MEQVVYLTYGYDGATVYDIKDTNSSFATGSLKVMYTGKNRNNTFISRGAVEKALPSLYNVPIVCHWKRDENEIGGHDMDIAMDSNGNAKLINLTEPCGVVPEHAKFSFQKIKDDDGVEHEYLVIDEVLLWKRQDVYSHIVDDLGGKVSHSMEISVKDGFKNRDTGDYSIKEFEFTALCLLESSRPCFEGSELEMFSLSEFKTKMDQMMNDVREYYTLKLEKGGEHSLDVNALLKEFRLEESDLDFETTNMEEEELRARFAEISAKKYDETDGETGTDNGDSTDTGSSDTTPDPDNADNSGDSGNTDTGDTTGDVTDPSTPDDGGSNNADAGDAGDTEEESEGDEAQVADDASDEDKPAKKKYGLLMEQIRSEICDAFSKIRFTSQSGYSEAKYYVYDIDPQDCIVYVFDQEDGHFFGFTYSFNGDNPVIDFASKKKKRCCFVDYNEGEPINDFFSRINENFTSKISALETELAELRQFKSDAVEDTISEMFAKFEELNGNDAFEALKDNHEGMTPDMVEEKCYSIKGRMDSLNFSLNQKPKAGVRIPVGKDSSAEPYGGIFIEYGKK